VSVGQVPHMIPNVYDQSVEQIVWCFRIVAGKIHSQPHLQVRIVTLEYDVGPIVYLHKISIYAHARAQTLLLWWPFANNITHRRIYVRFIECQHVVYFATKFGTHFGHVRIKINQILFIGEAAFIRKPDWHCPVPKRQYWLNTA